jgi:hypothetical protein
MNPFTLYPVLNCSSDQMLQVYKAECARLGLQTITALQPISDNSMHHGLAIDYIYQSHASGLSVFLDFDIFPIAPYDFIASLANYNIAGHRQKRGGYNYLHPALIVYDKSKLPDDLSFRPIHVFPNGNDLYLDTGGALYTYIQANPDLVKYFDYECPIKQFEYGKPTEYMLDIERFDNAWLHFRAGSNWSHDDVVYKHKMDLLLPYFNGLINESDD